MTKARLASGYRTVHKQATPSRSDLGSPGWSSRAAPPVVSRVVGERSPAVRDDQARALVLRDAERARRALWASCERRPMSKDTETG